MIILYLHLNQWNLYLREAVLEAVSEGSSCMPSVAGGTVGGVAIGTIVTLVVTVTLFKIRQTRLGTGDEYFTDKALYVNVMLNIMLVKQNA